MKVSPEDFGVHALRGAEMELVCPMPFCHWYAEIGWSGPPRVGSALGDLLRAADEHLADAHRDLR